jgi:hypothetical protein
MVHAALVVALAIDRVLELLHEALRVFAVVASVWRAQKAGLSPALRRLQKRVVELRHLSRVCLSE